MEKNKYKICKVILLFMVSFVLFIGCEKELLLKIPFKEDNIESVEITEFNTFNNPIKYEINKDLQINSIYNIFNNLEVKENKSEVKENGKIEFKFNLKNGKEYIIYYKGKGILNLNKEKEYYTSKDLIKSFKSLNILNDDCICSINGLSKEQVKLLLDGKSKFEKIIYSDIFFEDYDPKGKYYPVILMDTIKVKQENNISKVFLVVSKTNYHFDGVKFLEESGFVMALRYDIDDNCKIIKKWIPRDGAEYGESILEMTENDKNIEKNIFYYLDEVKNYQKTIDELKKVALALNLKKENFSFKLKEIPTYEKDVVYLENKDLLDIPKEGVCVIKKKDYDDLQNERKTIVKGNEAGTHWVYRNCILWNKKTGICTDYILDYFN